MAPRRLQDDSKTLPSRIEKQSYVNLSSQSPEMPLRPPRNPPRSPKRLPKRPPRRQQEAPRSSQEASKRPPRDPKVTHRHHKSEHFVLEGFSFLSYPIACNMSPLGRRRGPALRASIRRRTEGGTTGGSPQCQIPLGLIPQSWPLRSIRGPRHSADPLTANFLLALKSEQNA